MKAAVIRRTRADKIFDTCNAVLMVLLLLITLYPLYFVLIASVSDAYEVAKGNVFAIPKGITFESYMNVFRESRIWLGYRNTIFYAVFGTAFSLILTIPSAYALSKKTLPGRGAISIFFLIPMYFNGGLIPTYLVMKQINMVDQWYSLIFIGGLSVYNMIITRVYFQTALPGELYEAAHIDGAGDFRTFFSIALPLAKPIIAVIALYYSVGHWNGYFNALIYVSNPDYQPLQIVLRSILLLNETALGALDPNSMDEAMVIALTRRTYLASTMKYALIFIASAPLLIAYPFVQKYFVKGALIGSLKG